MNFFFGIKSKLFKSELQIPTFKNYQEKKSKILLFKAFIKQGKWLIEEMKENKINDHFYLLKNKDISNDEIYFLAQNSDLKNINNQKLKKFNNFTETTPDYRSNLKIFIKDGGFSSYQSEFPFRMVCKTGSVLTPINSLLNKDADNNYILFRNIYEYPIQENFNCYLIDYKSKKILDKFIVKTNFTNILEVKKEYISTNIFFFSEKYLGVPVFISVKNKFISFEHSQPLHEYILGMEKFEKVEILKKKFNEIIY